MTIFYILFIINCFKLMNSKIISNDLDKKLSISKCYTSDKLQLICICYKTEQNQQLSNSIQNIADCNKIYKEFFNCFNDIIEFKQLVNNNIGSSNSIIECMNHFYNARINKLKFEHIRFTASNLLEQSEIIYTLFKIFMLIFLLLILTFSFFLVWAQVGQCIINTFSFLKLSVSLDDVEAIPNLLDEELFSNNSTNWNTDGLPSDRLPSYEEATKNSNTEITL